MKAMSAMRNGLVTSAADLRREFDEHFQRPVALAREEEEELLALRARESLLAVRASESGGVLRCPRITRVPSPAPALLGICGVRGALVAAYDLAALVGSAAAPPGRWMILCGRDRSVGVVFDELQGCLRVPAREIRTAAGGARIAPEIVRITGETRAVIRIAALLEGIAGRGAGAGTEKE